MEETEKPPLSLQKSLIKNAQSITTSIQSGGSWRYITHVLLLVIIVSVAVAGKIQAESLSAAKKHSAVAASDQDQSVVLASGAILAKQTQLVMASDVKQRADNVASQTSLATSSESFLKSRAPIAATDPAKRSIINHTVAQGETVSSIATQFNVTSDTVLWANSLSADSVLKPGQELMILPINGLLYTVTGNESLEAVANTYKASANLIDTYNQLEGKPLAVGQKIIIPDGVKPAPAPTPAATNTRLASVAKPTTALPMRAGSATNSYAYGYCTYYVATRRAIPPNWGNASSWYYNATLAGYSVGAAPRAGAVAWEEGNHVAYVESVNADGTVSVSEMNYWSNGGGWGRVSYRTTAASRFKYIY